MTTGFNAIPNAFDIWMEITGSDPNARAYQTYRDLSLRSANDEIKEALALDSTNITVAFILDYYVRIYLKARTFTVQSILDDHTVLMSYLERCKQLYDILESEEIMEAKLAFQDVVRQSLEHYKITNQAVFDMVDNIHELGLLRRDALKSMEKLWVHQFTQGDSDGTRPIYYNTVYEYWNINSLIRDMSRTKMGGILLALIRDPQKTSSFFVFAFRNGGTITILTDQDKEPHPMAKYMSRRPDRSLGDRMFRNHFPYTSVLDIEFDYNDVHDSAYINDDSSELVKYQSEAVPRVKIADMLPDEVIWVSMMFSLIEERFWKQGYKTLELSYTTEMIRISDSLLSHASHLPAVVDQYKQLEASPLTIDDVSFEAVKEQWECEPTGHHKWMEDRYKHLIDVDMLNMMTPTSVERKLMLLSARDLEQLGMPSPAETLTEFNPSELEAKIDSLQWGERSNFKDKTSLTVRSLESTRFGTSEAVLNDYKWYGRYNYAKQVNLLAKKEFEARRDKVKSWFEERVKVNMPVLLKHVAIGSWIGDSINHKSGFSLEKGKVVKKEKLMMFHKSHDSNIYSDLTTRRSGTFLHKGQEGYTSKYYCYINGAVASIYSRFRVSTPADIAHLAGCKVSELPDVLQHWTPDGRYSGNSILDRVDPMEWVVENPWSKMGFDVVLFLSKSAYNDVCASHKKAPKHFEVAKKESSRW
jgi:hypothetical protein